jgi:hypothetical protein
LGLADWDRPYWSGRHQSHFEWDIYWGSTDCLLATMSSPTSPNFQRSAERGVIVNAGLLF